MFLNCGELKCFSAGIAPFNSPPSIPRPDGELAGELTACGLLACFQTGEFRNFSAGTVPGSGTGAGVPMTKSGELM
jgi:hypothetical protein